MERFEGYDVSVFASVLEQSKAVTRESLTSRHRGVCRPAYHHQCTMVHDILDTLAQRPVLSASSTTSTAAALRDTTHLPSGALPNMAPGLQYVRVPEYAIEEAGHLTF
uniref:Uncharacterized protein n=1 Tax=Peronospora matthiolae TaxID=2874970 RepID=A0AAV1UY80_9STRA